MDSVSSHEAAPNKWVQISFIILTTIVEEKPPELFWNEEQIS